MNIPYQEPCQDSTFPPSLFLESWRTWRFLMDLEFGSDEWEHLYEASVKFSSRSNIRNPVKTPPFLHVSSWSLRGHKGAWWNWSMGQMNGWIFMKLLWNFHQDPTSGTLLRVLISSMSCPEEHPISGALSRLHLSSKSLPGVLEDMEDPDGPEVGIRWRFFEDGPGVGIQAFVKFSSKSNIRKPIKTQPFLCVSFWSLGGYAGSWWTLSWAQSILMMFLRKFHQDLTLQTLSKLPDNAKPLCRNNERTNGHPIL